VAILPLAGASVNIDDASMNTEILIYDGFDELDAIGPFEVLSPLGARLVTLAPADVVSARHGLALVPQGTLSEAPDLLVIPGGGWVARDERAGVYAEWLRGTIPAAIARRHAAGSVVASVCTGAMLLARAGILEGRPAVTHHAALDDLRAAGADVRPDARWVDDGDVLTAGGVTSGIDLALHLLERFAGTEVAQAAERLLEHRRQDATGVLV
jgi:transcriptional regulator GlxA family with amidase domain